MKTDTSPALALAALSSSFFKHQPLVALLPFFFSDVRLAMVQSSQRHWCKNTGNLSIGRMYQGGMNFSQALALLFYPIPTFHAQELSDKGHALHLSVSAILLCLGLMSAG